MTLAARVDAKSHVYRTGRMNPLAEDRILAEFCRPGMRALDVGSGALGRSALKLRRFGAEVVTFDVNESSVHECARSLSSVESMRILTADLLRLPFRDRAFELVLIALNGLDYVSARSERIAALKEVERVLAPSGLFVFNAINPIGSILSPRGLFDRRYFKWRLRHLLTGGFLHETFVDLNGLRLHQGLPAQMIREVETGTAMQLVYSMRKKSATKKRLLLTLFAAAPYFVFRKPVDSAFTHSSIR